MCNDKSVYFLVIASISSQLLRPFIEKICLNLCPSTNLIEACNVSTKFKGKKYTGNRIE